MNVLVVGAGTMGGWLGEVFVSEFPRDVDLRFQDPDWRAARDTADAVGGKPVEEPLDSAPDSGPYEVVCFAVPMGAVTDAIATCGDLASRAVLDVSGVMSDPIEAMSSHARDCERVSLHPLFAPENEPGNVPYVSEGGSTFTGEICRALEARGNDVFETTPGKHDAAMRDVQAGAHAAILAFALASDGVPERFQTTVSSDLTVLATQVTDGESQVYADIQERFDGAEAVAVAAQQVASADRERFERLYDEAGPD